MIKHLAGIAALALAAHAQTYTISTVAGNGSAGFAGDAGPAAAAQLAQPGGMAIDKSGNVYIADTNNSRIRKIATDGTISTAAGAGGAGYGGDGGAATSALISNPAAVAADGSGNLYIADTGNHLIRKVTGTTMSTIAGNVNDISGFGGDNGPATSALLNQPTGVAVDASGNVYLSDAVNNRVRKVTAATGIITTYAGDGTTGSGGDGGRAVVAHLNTPRGLAVDAAGNLYIADAGNHRIRMVNTAGIISTLAGTGTAGFSGDLGVAAKAQLNSPRDVAVDAAGNVYIADYSNSRIRIVNTAGVISTIAGNGRFAYTGDGGAATGAALQFPAGVEVDASGKVYVADTGNSAIRLLTPNASQAKPTISAGGIIEPADFGGSPTVAPGTWIEIYGSGLASGTRTWTGAFTGINAPTSLNGTSVIIGGQQAFLSYVSDAQVNAQIPSGVAPGTQTVTVNSPGGTSAGTTVTVAATQPALFAPSILKIGGKQYVAAINLDGTWSLPAGVVAGIASRPAKPGEIVTLYGVGFGPVTPDTPAGQIVQASNTLATPVQVFFGGTPAKVQYAGLVTQAVGLYQINVFVPDVAAGDVPLTFSQGGVIGGQTSLLDTLVVAIGN